MNLQRRYFKGKAVWIEVDHKGDPIVVGGRVPMRYQNDPSAKVYNAGLRNISDKPADVIDAEAEFEGTQKKSTREKGTKSAAPAIISAVSPEDWGPLYCSEEAPPEIAALPAPPKGVLEIHTDGACSGNPGPCGYGVVIRDGEHYRELSQYLGIGTNNIAELTAIRVALEQVEDKSKNVHLYTDSSYSIGMLTKNWKAKANQELILSIKALMKDFPNLQIFKVKGHAGHPLNERADLMATSSLDRR